MERVVRSMSKETWSTIVQALCDKCKAGGMTPNELDSLLTDCIHQDQDTFDNARLEVIKELNSVIQKLNNKEI
jgi:hypothetical protein